jgi:hypothetical protein
VQLYPRAAANQENSVRNKDIQARSEDVDGVFDNHIGPHWGIHPNLSVSDVSPHKISIDLCAFLAREEWIGQSGVAAARDANETFSGRTGRWDSQKGFALPICTLVTAEMGDCGH